MAKWERFQEMKPKGYWRDPNIPGILTYLRSTWYDKQFKATKKGKGWQIWRRRK